MKRYHSQPGSTPTEWHRGEESRPAQQRLSTPAVCWNRSELENRERGQVPPFGQRTDTQPPFAGGGSVAAPRYDRYALDGQRSDVDRSLVQYPRINVERNPAQHYHADLGMRSVGQRPVELERRPVDNYRTDLERRSLEQRPVDFERRLVDNYNVDLGRSSLEQRRVEMERRPVERYNMDIERHPVERSPTELVRRPVVDNNVDLGRHLMYERRADLERQPVERYNTDIDRRSVEQRRIELERRPVDNYNIDLERRSVEQRRVELERRPVERYNIDIKRRSVEQSPIDLVRRPVDDYNVDFGRRSMEERRVEIERQSVERCNTDIDRRSVEQKRIELERRPADNHNMDFERRSVEQRRVELERRPVQRYDTDIERRSIEQRRIELEGRPTERYNTDLERRSSGPMDLERRASLHHELKDDRHERWRRTDPGDHPAKRRRTETREQDLHAKRQQPQSPNRPDVVPRLMQLAGCSDDRQPYTKPDNRQAERNRPEVVPRLMQLEGRSDDRQPYTKPDNRQAERNRPEVVPRLRQLEGRSDDRQPYTKPDNRQAERNRPEVVPRLRQLEGRSNDRQPYTKPDNRQAERNRPEVVPRLMQLAGCSDDRQPYTKPDNRQAERNRPEVVPRLGQLEGRLDDRQPDTKHDERHVERNFPEVVPRLMKLAGCLDERQGFTEHNNRRDNAPGLIEHAGPLEDRRGFAKHNDQQVGRNRPEVIPRLMQLAGCLDDRSQREVHLADRRHVQPERDRREQDRYHLEPERDRQSVWRRLEPEGQPADQDRPTVGRRSINRQWNRLENQPARPQLLQPEVPASDLLFNNIQSQLMVQSVQSELMNLNQAYVQGQTDLGLFGQGQLLDLTSTDVQRTLIGLNESGYLDQLMNVNLQDVLSDLNVAMLAPNGNAYQQVTGSNRSNFKMGPIQLRGTRSSRNARRNNLRTQTGGFPKTGGFPTTRGGGAKTGGFPTTRGGGAKTGGLPTTRGGGAKTGELPTTRGGEALAPLLTVPNTAIKLVEKREEPDVPEPVVSESESDVDSDAMVEPTERLPGTIVCHGVKPGKKVQRKSKRNLVGGIVTFVTEDGKEEKGKFVEEDCVCNGYRLKTMRKYAGDPTLTLPFAAGKAVSVIARRALPPSRYEVRHRVEIELPAAEGDGGWADDPLDGLKTEGTVTFVHGRSGTARFGRPARLARFETRDVVIGGLGVPPPAHPHVLYPGLAVTLVVTGSAGTGILGVRYTADASVTLPLAPDPSPDRVVEIIDLSSGPMDQEEATVSLSSKPMDKVVETISLPGPCPDQEEATISISSGPPEQEAETIAPNPGAPDKGVETISLSSEAMDQRDESITPNPGALDKEVEIISLSPGAMDQEAATVSLCPGDSGKGVETITLSPGPPEIEAEALNPGAADKVVETVSLSPGPLEQKVETISLSPGAMDPGPATVPTSAVPRDKAVETTPLPTATPYKLTKKQEMFNAVIVRMFNGRPVLLSCVNKANRSERFFVRCKEATVTGGHFAQSNLHFGEGTRVVCSLDFARDYGRVLSGRTYLASAHFPLKRATVDTLVRMRGFTVPRKLSFYNNKVRKSVTIRRRDLRVMGDKPGPTFPRDFFKVGMIVDINDCVHRYDGSPAATLDLSRFVLKTNKTIAKKKKKKLKLAARLPSAATMPKMPKVVVPLPEGEISAVHENADGMVCPTSAWTIVGGKRTKVHLSQVAINGRRNLHVPPSLFKIGDNIRLHALRFCAETHRFTAQVRHYFARRFFKKACDDHIKSLALTTRPDVAIIDPPTK